MPGALIVGAGLGGLRAAESLRASGFAGPITVIGDEPDLPYNRPPLSKEALVAGVDMSTLEFRRKASVADVAWELGTAVASADLPTRTVTLADGRILEFDGLVIATGIRSRRLPIPGPGGVRLTLRTAADAGRLRALLAPGMQLLILGAGFIGCEVAATARRLGVEVTVVAADEEPMVRPLGTELASAMRRRHEDHGVRFHLGGTVDAFSGTSAIQAATLSDGSVIPTNLVVEAVGSVPNVEWLEGNGLDLSDGVLVDSAMQVATEAAPVVAVGDIARHPNALFGSTPRRVEHWAIPTETGRRAGRTLAALMAGGEPDRSPFAVVPNFWSDQYDHTIQSFGMPGLATDARLVDGDLHGSCIVEYHDETGLVGVVGVDRTRDLAPYRTQLAERGRR